MDMIEQFEKWFTGEADCKTRKAMMEKDDAGYYKFQSAYNSFSSWKEAWQQQQAEITRLTGLVDSYKRDAERYRWLRDRHFQSDVIGTDDRNVFDADIDEAMKGNG